MWSELAKIESLETLEGEITSLERKLSYLKDIRDVVLMGDRADIGAIWLGDIETAGILRRNGINTLGDVQAASDAKLLKMWRMGPHRLRLLRTIVREHLADVARLRGVTPFQRRNTSDGSGAAAHH